MAKKIFSLLKKIKYKDKKNNNFNLINDNLEIPESINEVKKQLISTFNNSSDLVIREIKINNNDFGIVAFIDGLINKELVDSDIIRPLIEENEENNSKNINYIKDKVLNSCKINIKNNFSDCVNSILNGDTLIFIEGNKKGLSAELKGWEKRGIEEPPSNVVVRGPREGFTETLQVNTSMIRRKIKNTNLVFESMIVGERTNTDILICYIKDIANEEVINTVKERISRIDTDAILESGYIEEFIEDEHYSIFPTVGNTERPDVVAGKILEGRVAILCDGTPFVLTVPYLFVESLQTSEDYYTRYIYSIIIRFIRVLAVIITSMMPAYYVALLCFHQDIIPFRLLLSMTGSREGVPFSPFTEALLMVIVFELIREAGVRMPRQIGQAVSIVGAIVIGDAAVSAGIVSAPLIIVIATTAISSYIVTDLSNTLLIIRLSTMIAANIIGILGIVLVSMAYFIHMCSLKSFGVNYMEPFAPFNKNEMKDTFVRFPFWSMFKRPKSLVANSSNKA